MFEKKLARLARLHRLHDKAQGELEEELFRCFDENRPSSHDDLIKVMGEDEALSYLRYRMFRRYKLGNKD